MSALTFDKNELGNLEYSLQREMLATDRIGGYMSTTIVCCNTRRYHGLIVAPIDRSDRTYVLLSSLDETIIQHDQSFNLALHRYRGVYEPRGHKYITDFGYTPTPTITYRVGGVILRKELLWIHKRTQLMIRYTLLDAHSETKLRLRPFLAFRDKHALTKANMEADGHSYPAVNGVRCRMYPSFPWLYLQTTKPEAEFVPAPDWYYNFEYLQDLARGYDGYEDLLTTGYFETELKKGESIIFSASLDEMASPAEIERLFEQSIARRTHKIDFISCMQHSARQFIIRRPGGRTELVAGYPWHGVSGRQTFVALPGITLEQDHKEDCMDVLDTMIRDMRDGDFAGSASATVSADAPLWFYWTLQNLERHIGPKELWSRYGEAMKSVLEAYRRGMGGGEVVMHDNGLIWAAADNRPLTWMATMVDGLPVTQRAGYAVEIEALWYNAVMYTLELARKHKDKEFVDRWKAVPELTRRSFLEKFWLDEEGFAADYVNGYEVNKYIRCNMAVACGLNYTMLSDAQRVSAIMTMRQHLLTPRGLRSLSPRNPLYESSYAEDQRSQDLASRNGSVWIWPFVFYVKSCFELSGGNFADEAREMLHAFNGELQTHCIGSVGERFEADPPFAARGSVSHATSVGGLLYINRLIDEYSAARQDKDRAAAKGMSAAPAAPGRAAAKAGGAKGSAAAAKSAAKRGAKKAAADK